MNGFNNLFAMELDPTSSIQEMIEQCTSIPLAQTEIHHLTLCFRVADNQGAMGSMMQDLAFAIPGVDEAMSFAEIMKSVSAL